MTENITPPPAGPAPQVPDSQVRMWNMFCHLSTISGYVGVPFGNILGPLLIWQIKKEQIPSVEAHGKAALNFQITVLIALVAGGVVAAILSFFCIGFLLIPVLIVVALLGVIFPIIAAVKANEGKEYQYPWSLKLIT